MVSSPAAIFILQERNHRISFWCHYNTLATKLCVRNHRHITTQRRSDHLMHVRILRVAQLVATGALTLVT
jgi:hypothetical protein